MGFRGPLFGTLVFYFFFAPPAIRSHTWRAPTSELLPRLKAAQRFASGRAAGGLLFRKCQVQPVLLTADEEHTLNEFHRRQFVGDHRKRRSLLRASTMASNSVSLIIGTLAIGVSCVVAICAVQKPRFASHLGQETSMESWNNSASGSSGKDELMKALQVYQTKAHAHVVLVPALLVTIVGFLGSLHRNSHLLAIYVLAVTLFVLLPFVIPALCIGPETTIRHRSVDVCHGAKLLYGVPG
ncbi:hypothetical protein MRX96_059873 [Rhipicephalus microplus]